MYRITGVIEGVAPILFNRMVDDSALRDGSSGGKFTDDERMAEALLKVHRTSTGAIGLPAWNLKKCMSEGAVKGGLKEGKLGFAKLLEASVFVDGELSFGVNEPDYIHETQGKRPPRTGGAVLIKRPALQSGWRLPFVFNVVDDRRPPEHIRKALGEAGTLVGLGSWRPEYGRFVVSDWQVSR